MVTETQRNKVIGSRSNIWARPHVLGFRTYKKGILDIGKGFLVSYIKNFPVVYTRDIIIMTAHTYRAFITR